MSQVVERDGKIPLTFSFPPFVFRIAEHPEMSLREPGICGGVSLRRWFFTGGLLNRAAATPKLKHAY